MKNSKIFLIRNTDSTFYGGAESYQLELSKVLQKNNFQPIIIASSSRLLDEAKKNNILAIKSPYCPIQNWSSWRNLLLPIYFIWQLKLYFWYKKQIKIHNPLAFDIQSRDDWLAATLAAKKHNIKIFWTDHIDFRTWVLTNVNKKFKNPIGKFILKLAKHPKKIFMISKYEFNWFKENISSDLPNLSIMRNGVMDRYDEYKKVLPKHHTFCYIGRIVDYKGIKELIKAFNLVSKKYNDAILNIYGDGPDLNKYIEMSKNNHKINFYGYSKCPLMNIADSDIFVLPSYYEGLSMSLLDASMLGKPIIATNVDGNPEVVIDNKTGILVPAKNVQQLAQAMLKMLDNTNFKNRVAKNVRKHYEQNFNFEENVKRNLITELRS